MFQVYAHKIFDKFYVYLSGSHWSFFLNLFLLGACRINHKAFIFYTDWLSTQNYLGHWDLYSVIYGHFFSLP